MPEFQSYGFAFLGIFIILLTVFVQMFVASMSKASQPGAVPGKIDDNLGHSSFVFRSHRTFQNSLENLPVMLGTSFLAVFIGANAYWTGLLVWAFALARIVHMILYYKISTDKNPSPRSYFFIIGVFSNIGLLVLCGIQLA